MGNRFRGGIKPKAMPPLHKYLGNPVLIARTALLSQFLRVIFTVGCAGSGAMRFCR